MEEAVLNICPARLHFDKIFPLMQKHLQVFDSMLTGFFHCHSAASTVLYRPPVVWSCNSLRVNKMLFLWLFSHIAKETVHYIWNDIYYFLNIRRLESQQQNPTRINVDVLADVLHHLVCLDGQRLWTHTICWKFESHFPLSPELTDWIVLH